MASVTYDRAAKHFGDVVALHELSLDVADGEFMVLVGPSGSGKTTALRLLAGLEGLSGGHIRIGEDVVDRVPPRRRDIAMVFQDYALYPQMSVRDNLAFGLKMAKVPRAEIGRRVAAAAEALDIGELLGRKPRQLSGGERQRVALGRALVREPRVFLMDEPLSNLDAKLRAQTRGEIKRLQRLVGTTTVYVTHDQVEAMTMGDRIAVMNQGRLEQVGDPDTVYSRPANTFVAAFIGSPSMALVACSRDGDGGLVCGDVRVPLPDGGSGLPDEVVLGVRPEWCRPWRDGAGLLGPFQGCVEYVEALGRETFIGVEAADGARFVIEADGSVRLGIGEATLFGLVPGGLHLFEAATGAALTTV
jgi:ABC-type sugar transport system ATPase subunit